MIAKDTLPRGRAEGFPKGGISEKAAERRREGLGGAGVEEKGLFAVVANAGNRLGPGRDHGASRGHVFEQFDRRAVGIALGNDTDIHGGEERRNFVMRNGIDKRDAVGDAEIDGETAQIGTQFTLSDEDQTNPGKLRREIGKAGDETVELVPRHEPTDEPDEKLPFAEGVAPPRRRGGRKGGVVALIDGIGKDKDLVGGKSEI